MTWLERSEQLQSNVTPAQVWTIALEQLQQQMTQATFDSWVKETQLISADNGTWQIGVKSEFAKDWLENRLLSTISRTVSGIVGSPVQLEFVVAAGLKYSTQPPQQRLLTGQMADILNFDVYSVGYTNHAHYIQQFWGAYLGAEALQVWSYLRSFYTEPRYIYDRKEKAYVLNPNWTPWTPPRAFRAVELARTIKSQDGREGNRKKITGAW